MASFAGLARRQVDEYLLELVVAEPQSDLVRGVLVRRVALDASEPGCRRRPEAVEERQLAEQDREVGGEARHARG
jgi:hypothetical protein